MSSFTEQDALDPDDLPARLPPLRLSERAAKLGPSVSQGARSEHIRSSPISRPASLDPKAINEHTRDLDRIVCCAKRCRSRRCGRWHRGDRRIPVRHHEACLTAIGRRFNPFRHKQINEHRSASVEPRRRRIGSRRARRVQSAPRVTA